MNYTSTRRGFAALAAAAVISLVGAVGAATAQDLPGRGNIRFESPNGPINAARDVAWDQKLDKAVSLDTPFRDENGKTVPLSSYFGKKPVMLVLPFYKCPGICSAELNGMVDTFKDPSIRYKVGRDFDVVTVSINPKEGADLATMKKKEYLDILMQPGAERGWHFLTGDEASIKKLADEVGFRYKYDAKTDQYAHPGGVVILTPNGRVSRYFFGVMFPPKDVRLGLTEAGQGRIGTVADKFVLACYHYDPQTGKYGLAIFRLLQFSGAATLLILGTFMLVMFRKDARDKASGGVGLPPSSAPPQGEA
jgi:protein SCO1/2